MKTLEWRRKTTKVIKLQWIASIWRQNDKNYKRDQITINLHRFDVKTLKRSKMLSDVAKQQKPSNYNELHRVDVRTIENVELRRKTFKTTLNYKSNQITTDCIDLMAKTSNQRKTTKVIILRWNCIDLTSKRSKQRKTTKRIKL